MSSLRIAAVSLEMVAAVRPLVARVKPHNRSLTDQLLRAASSVALNIAEAEYSDPGNKRARLFTAAGSANETRAAIRVAMAWGYFGAPEAEAVLGMLEHIIAVLWKMTRGRG